MNWYTVNDNRHYRAVGRFAAYDLRCVQRSWEVWVQRAGESRFRIITTGVKYLYEAKKLAEEMEAR